MPSLINKHDDNLILYNFSMKNKNTGLRLGNPVVSPFNNIQRNQSSSSRSASSSSVVSISISSPVTIKTVRSQILVTRSAIRSKL